MRYEIGYSVTKTMDYVAPPLDSPAENLVKG